MEGFIYINFLSSAQLRLISVEHVTYEHVVLGYDRLQKVSFLILVIGPLQNQCCDVFL